MILRRLGNKTQMVDKITPHFPSHKVYIEPFFGAGGMFFNKPKVKYNIVNDLDGDVFNLFQVVMNFRKELEDAYLLMPIHTDLLEYWKENKEEEPIKKALRFLFLSNVTFMGTGDAIKFGTENPKNPVYNNMEQTAKLLHDVQFMNKDFRKFFTSIQIREPESTFIYCDPPYLETANNYVSGFTEQDSFDLFDSLVETGCKFAMSEFNHDFIIEQAKGRGLNIISLGERQNLKNRRVEVLITNYFEAQQQLFKAS